MNKKYIYLTAVAVLLVVSIVVGAVLISQRGYRENKFNKTVYTVSGGSAQERANIKNISLDKIENGVELGLHFVSGSEADGGVTQCGVPEYEVKFLQSPLRMQVTLKNVLYWDYVISGMPGDTTGIISGMFMQSPDTEGGDTVLYFVLAQDVRFKLSENENTLNIAFEKEEKQKIEEKYYICADLYYEYQQGQMPECGFTPMLCDDNISVIMISAGYFTRDEAQAAADALLISTLEGYNLRIVSLVDGDFPPYADNADTQALLSESIMSVDGAKTTLPLFFADARFLCWNEQDGNALFAKSENGTEKLYIAGKDGTKHLLTEQGFSTIVKAAFSEDGSRLAFIEQAEEVALVTVVDVSSGKITVVGAGEDKFGVNILGVQLNEDGSKLYCLSGSDTYSIDIYDFSTGEITVLCKDILLEGDLIYNEGYLYYCDVVDEYEAIVRRNIITNEVENIHKGAQFVLSHDGKMLITIAEDYETAVYDLRVVHIESGSWQTIYEDVVTNEFFFSSDSKSIYYVVETGDPEFYYQIMRYDIDKLETTALAQCINCVFFASDTANEIIISAIYEGNNGAMPVTYIANFDKVITGEPEIEVG